MNLTKCLTVLMFVLVALHLTEATSKKVFRSADVPPTVVSPTDPNSAVSPDGRVTKSNGGNCLKACGLMGATGEIEKALCLYCCGTNKLTTAKPKVGGPLSQIANLEDMVPADIQTTLCKNEQGQTGKDWGKSAAGIAQRQDELNGLLAALRDAGLVQ